MKQWNALFLVLLVIGVSGCAQEVEEVTIGWIGPLTGDVAFLGISNKQGVELAVKEINDKGGINGKPVRVIFEDDSYDSKKSVTAFQKLVNVDGVDAVLMVTYSGLLSVATMADEQKVITVNSLDTSEEIAKAGDWVFGVGVYDEAIGYSLAEHLVSQGVGKAGLIYYQDDAFFPLVKNGFVERFEELGGEVVIIEGYSTGETDFRSRLLKVQEAGAEAIGILGYDEGGFALKQARELDVQALYFGADTVTSPNFIANANDNVDGLVFTFWEGIDQPKVPEFIAAFTQNYGEAPEFILYTGVGYDATNVVANALGSTDPKAALYGLQDYQGLTGTLTMSPDGIVRTITEDIYRFEGTDFVRVS